ncbi:hypothetical protein ACMHYO_08630 [Allopusillimonas ginsengisoli]|uniref:hypothetical protein n=1 Tax=Allopusillimonas ginsengisoli TaxID=453575 RepID=UPI0039C30121
MKNLKALVVLFVTTLLGTQAAHAARDAYAFNAHEVRQVAPASIICGEAAPRSLQASSDRYGRCNRL